jgi:hypothetical protein
VKSNARWATAAELVDRKNPPHITLKIQGKIVNSLTWADEEGDEVWCTTWSRQKNEKLVEQYIDNLITSVWRRGRPV